MQSRWCRSYGKLWAMVLSERILSVCNVVFPALLQGMGVWYLSFSTMLLIPFSKAKCLPEEMNLEVRTSLSCHPSSMPQTGLEEQSYHLSCSGYGFSSSERLDSTVCLVLSGLPISITIFSVGREERCCYNVIPHSDVEIFLFLDTFLHLASRHVVQ